MDERSPTAAEERRAFTAKRRLPKEARKQLHGFKSAVTIHEDETAKADLARRNRVRAIIEANQLAAVFDAGAARTLAARDLYPHACAMLTKAIRWPVAGPHESPHVMVWQSTGDVLAFRLAFSLGVVPVTACGNATTRVGVEWLRERAPECETTRTILALLGECPDWSAAGPRERAGLLLHATVEARR